MRDADATTKTTKFGWSCADAMMNEEVHAAAMKDPDARPMTDAEWDPAPKVPRTKTLRRALGLTQEESQSNLAKHLVSFEAARRVFDHAFALDRLDIGSRGGEVRYVITGMVNGVLLTVVYMERGVRTCIISARKATKHEQREYDRNQTAE